MDGHGIREEKGPVLCSQDTAQEEGAETGRCFEGWEAPSPFSVGREGRGLLLLYLPGAAGTDCGRLTATSWPRSAMPPSC
jgi:hypothetical protein